MPNRAEWLTEYEFPLEYEHDFELSGCPASWASGHPKEWSDYSIAFELPVVKKDGSERTYKSIVSALSGDSKLLAISSDDGKILIYDVDSKELRQELDGTGQMVFAPLLGKKGEESGENEMVEAGSPAYTLVSSVSDVGAPRHRSASKLVVWELDKKGRLLDEEEPVDAAVFATKAIDSITAQLEAEHEWSKDFITSSTLHADFEKALTRVAADHRRRHNTTIDNATLLSFGSSTFSSDGKLMLYTENHSEQKAPVVVVWDVKAGKEVLRLAGHIDAIMYASFSPDDANIATVSWDGTMRMHSSTTGSLIWATPNSGGQSWTAAFTPDSQHIVWSSKNGGTIQVHKVYDGALVATFQKKFNSWCRTVTWHPDGEQLVICAEGVLYIWRPFDGPNGTVTQHFELANDKWHGFGSIESVEWLDRGRKLVLIASDGSRLVWDPSTNARELFRRPKGTQVAWTQSGFFFKENGGTDLGDMYLSVDGDGKVRYWRVSVPANSWWDKKEEPKPKKEYPETGKYVNIVKRVKTEVGQEEKTTKDKEVKTGEKEVSARDEWAEKGAGLWTAE